MAGHTANVLMLGRFLTGLGVGIVSNVVPVYIADVAPPKLRGTLGATNQLGITLGILLVYLLGLEVRSTIPACLFNAHLSQDCVLSVPSSC